MLSAKFSQWLAILWQMWANSNVIILCFNAYSCGKFLSNILSYNKNFIPQYPFGTGQQPIQAKDIDYNQMSFDELLSARHTVVMQSLPPRDDVTNWVYYELGCEQFWGTHADSISKIPISAKAEWAMNQGKYCCIMAHNPDQAKVLTEHFPFAIVVKIVNDCKINLLSKKIKTNKPAWYIDFLKTYRPAGCLEFDINSLFDQDLFFKNIDQLLLDIGVEDRSLDPRVTQYYQTYCKFYSDLV
jgi:hypothetical protein